MKLSERFLGGIASVSFFDVLHYSFWEEAEEDGAGGLTYRLHNVMREQLQALLKHEQAGLVVQIHEYMFESYDAVFERIAEINQSVMKEHSIQRPYDDIEFFGKLLKPYEAEITDLLGQYNSALQEGLYHLEQVDSQRLPLWLSQRDGFHRKPGHQHIPCRRE